MQTWYSGSGCIPGQLCKVSPKSHCDFLFFSIFSLVGCWDVNSSLLTFVLVGFGGNLVQGFRVYPWTTVPSFPQIVLWFSLFLMFSLVGCWDVNSSLLTFVLVGFGGNLVQGFRVYAWMPTANLIRMPRIFKQTNFRNTLFYCKDNNIYFYDLWVGHPHFEHQLGPNRQRAGDILLKAQTKFIFQLHHSVRGRKYLD